MRCPPLDAIGYAQTRGLNIDRQRQNPAMIPTKAPLAMSSDSSIRFIDISAKVELRLFIFHSFMHSPPPGKYIEHQSNLCRIL